MKVFLGHSEYFDAIDAVEDVLNQCQSQLQGKKPQMGILLANHHYEHKILLEKIKAAFPDMLLVGASTVAEMSSVMGYQEGSVILALFHSDKVKMYGTVVRDISRDTFEENFKKAIDDLPKGVLEKSVCCFTLPDTMTMSLDLLINHLKGLRGEDYPIIGGGASDDWAFQTRQFFNTEIFEHAAPMVFFTGPLEISIMAASGWEPFSPIKELIKKEINIAQKISEYKALDFFEHYLNTRKASLVHPLAIFSEQDKFYLRAPIGENETDNTVAFGCPLPEGVTNVCIATTTPEKILEATAYSVDRALGNMPAKADVCLTVSCICRQSILGTRTPEESEAVTKSLKVGVPFLGFYAFAQLGPCGDKGASFAHNETFITILMREKNE